jgi:pyruvate carboxylase
MVLTPIEIRNRYNKSPPPPPSPSLSHSLNYLDNLLFGVDAVRAVPGAVAQGTLCYTGDLTNPARSDKYTLDYYLKLADALVGAGAHCLAVKDMAGLLKPAAATTLVSALRAAHPTTPIHVHTHDTAGTGVATALAAAAAGADVVDCAVDAMAGATSQPSLGAVVACTAGTPLDTGIDAGALGRLSSFWEGTRKLYAPYESDFRAPSADVYLHEMPGGQYTNLKFQATSLGLGDAWDAVKTAYAAANRALGDIVKVTPSSKVVGDLAQFMVANGLDEASVVDRAEELSFPSSVVEYFQGALGQPAGGFPEPLRARVLKGAPTIDGRPGASLPDFDLAGLAATLRSKHGPAITARDALSSALYPAVFEEAKEWEGKYSRFTAALPTRAFLAPLREDEEVEVELAPGNVVSIKYKAVSPLRADGTRDVFFEANGVPRVVDVADERAADGGGAGAPLKRAARERADPMVLGSVGAPMAGEVVDIKCAPGTRVAAGEALVVLSAMKMETQVAAPTR